ncbi:glutamine synthetase family protein [Streptomyces sp. Rer75]|uniref:glutamine synthetase family protein n=1 Tax=Streptomyces sp. Rer75 TaxID=2750011 RepID=UPI0015D01543|nr:glutamine synthetase family protein [Streptomyces sp. Rer75]QLH19851.1 glutamine synthetase [Streptomyces sp. Rer75]
MGTGDREQAQARARQEADRLTAQGIHGIALTWVDNAGLTRVKSVPTGRLAHSARRGVGMSPVFDVYLVDDSMTTSPHIGGPDGDLRLFPDLDRLTVLAAQPGWAWAPADRYAQSGLEHPTCQRLFARRMAERAHGRGIALRMGFETEWIVTTGGTDAAGGTGAPRSARDTPGPVPYDATPGPRYAGTGPAYGMARLVDLSGYLADVLDTLHTQGVEVLQLHPEYAAGQFEVSVAPADPVGAADLAVLVRETIRGVSARHGLTPLFGPVAEAGTVGNGGHLHLSLWQGERNLCRDGDGPHGMTATSEAFLAGVLRALPALLAIGAPSPASYLRLEPSRWAGAYQCWGLENREAALRFITGAPDDPGGANAEVKCFDPAANPYLVTGAVIAAGLAGLDAGLTLPPPVSGDPARTDRERRLPTSLPAALEHFEDSAVLREALGDPLFESIAAVRRAEAALFEKAAPQEIAAATRGRY